VGVSHVSQDLIHIVVVVEAVKPAQVVLVSGHIVDGQLFEIGLAEYLDDHLFNRFGLQYLVVRVIRTDDSDLLNLLLSQAVNAADSLKKRIDILGEPYY
jgi:hypothetical protein